jgi:ribonuclease J
MEEAKDIVINSILNCDFKSQDWSVIKNNLKKSLTSFFYKKLKRKPMIVPIIMETK